MKKQEGYCCYTWKVPSSNIAWLQVSCIFFQKLARPKMNYPPSLLLLLSLSRKILMPSKCLIFFFFQSFSYISSISLSSIQKKKKNLQSPLVISNISFPMAHYPVIGRRMPMPHPISLVVFN